MLALENSAVPPAPRWGAGTSVVPSVLVEPESATGRAAERHGVDDGGRAVEPRAPSGASPAERRWRRSWVPRAGGTVATSTASEALVNPPRPAGKERAAFTRRRWRTHGLAPQSGRARSRSSGGATSARGCCEPRRAPRALSARRSRLRLVVSATGAGGWDGRAFRARGRRRSADGRLTVAMVIGSIIGPSEQFGKSVPA